MPVIPIDTIRGLALLASVYTHLFVGVSSGAEPIKNIIVFVQDGGGNNAVLAGSMYQGKVGKQVFEGDQWTKTWVSTYPLRAGHTPMTGPEGVRQDPAVMYDPAKIWDKTPVETRTGAFPDRFAGYAFAKISANDSASTATGIATGCKTYISAINMNGNGEPVQAISQLAKAAGKRTGVVTTVQFSDATPAAFGGAHAITRTMRAAIANEMTSSPTLDVIMGAGNPDFDDNGKPAAKPGFGWIAKETWERLKRESDGASTDPGKWLLIQRRSEFESLVSQENPPRRVIGLFECNSSNQLDRAGGDPAHEEPFSVPMNKNVPSLTTMAMGAINILDDDPAGFFLLIEGGATDRAEHANNMGRVIEEVIAFNQTIERVVAYLDSGAKGNTWSNTLVIITADHDHVLMGPDGATEAFSPLKDNGKGNVPGYSWHHNSHGNFLLPTWLRGPGSELIPALEAKDDPVRGKYLDQTDLFRVMRAALERK